MRIALQRAFAEAMLNRWSETVPQQKHTSAGADRARRARPPAVIGHSMGSKTAIAPALLHPAFVARLVMAGIAPVPYSNRFLPNV